MINKDMIVDDTGWIDLVLLNKAKEGTLCGTPQYRKIGNEVYLRGSIAFTMPSGGSIELANIPKEIQPKNNIYYLAPLRGERIARFIIYSGKLHCEWIINIKDGSKYSGEMIWTDINKIYRVD